MRAIKESNIEIGKFIKRERLKINLTQEQLAEKVNITPNHLSAIERGVSGVSLETAKKLCDEFNISIEALMLDDIEKVDENDQHLSLIIEKLRKINPRYLPQLEKFINLFMEIRYDFLIISLEVLICRYSLYLQAFPAFFISGEFLISSHIPLSFCLQR